MEYQIGDTVSLLFFSGTEKCFIKNILELFVREEKKQLYVLTYKADKFNLVKGEDAVKGTKMILTEKINKKLQ